MSGPHYTAEAASPPNAAAGGSAWPSALAGLSTFGAAMAASEAGPWSWLVALAGAGAVVWLARQPATQGSNPSHGSIGNHGARLMVSKVVPVWKRHVEASKQEADKGIGHLLENFSSLSDGLTTAARQADWPTMTAGLPTLEQEVSRLRQALADYQRQR